MDEKGSVIREFGRMIFLVFCCMAGIFITPTSGSDLPSFLFPDQYPSLARSAPAGASLVDQPVPRYPFSPAFPPASVSAFSLDNGYYQSVVGENLFRLFIAPGTGNLTLQISRSGQEAPEKEIILQKRLSGTSDASAVFDEAGVTVAFIRNDNLYLQPVSSSGIAEKARVVAGHISAPIEITRIQNEFVIVCNRASGLAILKGALSANRFPDLAAGDRFPRSSGNQSYGLGKPRFTRAHGNLYLTYHDGGGIRILLSRENGRHWRSLYRVPNLASQNGFLLSEENDSLVLRFRASALERVARFAAPPPLAVAPGGIGDTKSLENVVVYPNPFRSSESLTGAIHFLNITPDVHLRVYTPNGRLVEDASVSNSNGELTWDVRNRNGNPVASGIYLYLLRNAAGEKKTGKLAIIR